MSTLSSFLDRLGLNVLNEIALPVEILLKRSLRAGIQSAVALEWPEAGLAGLVGTPKLQSFISSLTAKLGPEIGLLGTALVTEALEAAIADKTANVTQVAFCNYLYARLGV